MGRVLKAIIILAAVVSFAQNGYCQMQPYKMTQDDHDGGGGGQNVVPQLKAYHYLYDSMDKYHATGMRLLESYSAPYHSNQTDGAWIYDNALAIVALTQRGWAEDLARARLLCETLIWAQNNDQYYTDGRLRDAYYATNIVFPGNGKAAIHTPNSSAGNMAWVIIAWLYYYNHANDPDQPFRQELLEAAARLGSFVENNFWSASGPYPGYHIGYWGWEPNQGWDPDLKSTEHNADLYVAFQKLFAATGNSTWSSSAIKARTFVTSMYTSSQHRYYTGTTTAGGINTTFSQQAVDANTMPILALADYSPINWLEANCRLTNAGFEGFDFNTDRDGVWFEGTAQMSVCYREAGNFAESYRYATQLRNAQTNAPQGNGKGIACASKEDLTTGFDWYYYRNMGVAPTCWFIFEEIRLNPFD